MSDPAIPVHIYFVLDRSGSMANLVENVVTGFNTFLKEQQAEPGECSLTMIQFDSEDPHEILYDAVPIADAQPLTAAQYVPRGGTPLLDAEGWLINRDDAVPIADAQPLTAAQYVPRGGTPLLDAEGWLINRAKHREITRTAAGEVAEAILFATFTDGYENASREWTNEKLTEAKTQLEGAGWTFTYLGVGLDNYSHVGQGTATGTRMLLSNQANAAGVASTFGAASFAASNVRSASAGGQSIDSTSLYAGYDDGVSILNIVDDDGKVDTKDLRAEAKTSGKV